MREYMLAMKDRQAALDKAIDYCIEKGILKEILIKNRTEVLGMLLEEFDAEKYERTIREEGREEGIKEGIKRGHEDSFCYVIEILCETDVSRDSAKKKLMEKYSLSEDETEQKLRLYWK